MARVIEFHIPSDFRPKMKWVPQEERGKILEFPGLKRATASVPAMQRRDAGLNYITVSMEAVALYDWNEL